MSDAAAKLIERLITAAVIAGLTWWSQQSANDKVERSQVNTAVTSASELLPIIWEKDEALSDSIRNLRAELESIKKEIRK